LQVSPENIILGVSKKAELCYNNLEKAEKYTILLVYHHRLVINGNIVDEVKE